MLVHLTPETIFIMQIYWILFKALNILGKDVSVLFRGLAYASIKSSEKKEEWLSCHKNDLHWKLGKTAVSRMT